MGTGLALKALLPFARELINKIWPDPVQQAEAQLKLATLEQNGELAQLASVTALAQGQIEVNKIEAASARLFVAGWRPFIGWICGVALAFDTIVRPAVIMAMAYAGHPAPVMPNLSTEQIYGLLFGLLGLGTLRTAEKIKGAA